MKIIIPMLKGLFSDGYDELICDIHDNVLSYDMLDDCFVLGLTSSTSAQDVKKECEKFSDKEQTINQIVQEGVRQFVAYLSNPKEREEYRKAAKQLSDECNEWIREFEQIGGSKAIYSFVSDIKNTTKVYTDLVVNQNDTQIHQDVKVEATTKLKEMLFSMVKKLEYEGHKGNIDLLSHNRQEYLHEQITKDVSNLPTYGVLQHYERVAETLLGFCEKTYEEEEHKSKDAESKNLLVKAGIKGLDQLTIEEQHQINQYIYKQVSKQYNDFYIRVDKNLTVDKAKELLSSLTVLPVTIQPKMEVVVKDGSLTREECVLIDYVNEFAKNNNYQEVKVADPGLKFKDQIFSMRKGYENAWSVDTIQQANFSIDHVVEEIRKARLTPLEAIAYVHEFVSCIVPFSKSKEKNYYRKEAGLVGAFEENGNFVCNGFAALFTACLEKLDMPGILVQSVNTHVIKKESKENLFQPISKDNPEKYLDAGGHTQVLIYVEDGQYNKEGLCLCDATWEFNGKRKEGTVPYFASCMLPAKAIYNARDLILQPCEPINKHEAISKSANEEDMVNGKMVQRQIEDVEQAESLELSQKEFETVLVNMYQKTRPEMTKQQGVERVKDIVERSACKSRQLWQKDVIVIKNEKSEYGDD